MDRELWRSWLKRPWSCALLQGRWRASAYAIDQNEAKDVRQRFHVKHVTVRSDASSKLWPPIELKREWLDRLLRPHDAFGITRRLLLNQREPGEAGALLQRVGFVHLLTVTGIHLYALAALWNRILLSLTLRLRLSLQTGRALRGVIVAASWSYAWALCGCRPGMLRPWGVIIVRKLAENLGWRWTTGAPLLISLSFDIAVAFHSLLTHSGEWAPGRIIYALAVGGGIWAVTSAGKFSHFGLSIGSWVFAAHFEAAIEQWSAPLTPLINLVTLPIFCLALYPAALLSSIAPHLSLSEFATALLSHSSAAAGFAIERLLALIFGLPCLWILKPWAWVTGLVSASLSAAFRIRPVIFCTFLIFARGGVELFSATQRVMASSSTFDVEQWDVGQGDATWLHSQDGEIGLIDAGSVRALSETAWIERLGARASSNPSHIAWVALTHLDEDHSGGLLKLALIANVDCVVAPRGELESKRGAVFRAEISKHGIPVFASSESNPCIPFDIQVTRLHKSGYRKRMRNSEMLAFAVPTIRGWYANAGDADQELESIFARWLVSRTGWAQGAERILKLSHHGSRYSSSEDFLRLLKPTAVWISSGVGNPHGHPAAQTLKRVERAQIRKLKRTDREGTLGLY